MQLCSCVTYISLPDHCIGCSLKIDRRQFVGRSIRVRAAYKSRLPVPNDAHPLPNVRLDFHATAMRPDSHLANMFGTLSHGRQLHAVRTHTHTQKMRENQSNRSK